jgi:hypothetical protein
MNHIEQTILEFIQRATKANPMRNVFLRGLIDRTYLQTVSERQIKQIIRKLREQGYPILASREKPFGYFYASSVEEIKDYEKTFLSQARSEFRTFRAMRKAFDLKRSGQQSLI